MVFEDGRKLVCTPDHRLLKSDGSWVESKDFILNKDRVMISISYPSYDEKCDIEKCNGWSYVINTGDYNELSKTLKKGRSLNCLKNKSILSNILSTSTACEFNRTMTIARLTGLLITDGSVSKSGECVFFCGHMMDVDMLQRDINLICGRTLSNTRQKSCWTIRAPVELSYLLSHIGNIALGKKTRKPHLLPEFINENCPIPILREFMGGLFGGDGCTISLNKKSDDISGISFVNSSEKENLDSLREMLILIKNILKKCFDIESTITVCERKTIKSILGILMISRSDTVKFSEKIGFRYCVHKTQRLNAAVSYINLRDKVGEQFNKVVKLSQEMASTQNIPLIKAVELVHEQIKTNDTILNDKYSLPSYQQVVDRLKKTSKFSNKKIS